MLYLCKSSTVCTLRLHINQVLVEVLELFHGGPEGHNLAVGVCRGAHLCSRHPASSTDAAREIEVYSYPVNRYNQTKIY